MDRIFRNFKLCKDKKALRESIALDDRCFKNVKLNIRLRSAEETSQISVVTEV